MGIIFIILIIVLLELIQILNSRFKIRKYILPTLFFLNSINIILGMLVFEKHDALNNKIDSITSICNILYFILLNIPTVIFIITNYIVDKKQCADENFFKRIKKFALTIFIILLIVILHLLYNLFGYNSVNLKDIASNEKEEILEVIGVNNIKDELELEKIETPKTYKDIYYVLYFSMNLDANKDELNNNEKVEYKVIKEKDNLIKYCCTISDHGKSIMVLEQIIDKYNK